MPFGEGEFDLVAATDVIEHVEAEQAALGELSRVAAPGAAMLLTVPAYMWLWSEEDDNLHHKRRYTRPRLRQAVERCGWTTEIATYFNSILLPPIALAKRLPQRAADRKADLERTPSALNGPLAMPMRVEAALIRRGAKLPAGVSVGIVCRKPGQPAGTA